MESVGVLVPVKAFSRAKLRLSTALEPHERASLARRMAEVVLAAANPLPVSVVCDDRDVATWASGAGARVIWTPGLGLDGAVHRGLEVLGGEGAARVVVAHADLPLATKLDWIADFDGVTLVPDRRRDGTNVACVPPLSGFRFSYGAGSFQRHLARARQLDLTVRIVQDARLGWDVDLPADLILPSPT